MNDLGGDISARGDVDEQEALGQATLWPLSVVQAALRAAPARLPARTRQPVPLLPIVRAGISLSGDETTEDRESRLLSSQVMRTQARWPCCATTNLPTRNSPRRVAPAFLIGSNQVSAGTTTPRRAT